MSRRNDLRAWLALKPNRGPIALFFEILLYLVGLVFCVVVGYLAFEAMRLGV